MSKLRTVLLVLFQWLAIGVFAEPGQLDLTFTPLLDGSVDAVALQADGKILIGGSFGSVDQVSRNRLARLNPDGTLDSSFDPNLDGNVRTIVIQEDGKVLVGGSFGSVGSVTRRALARLNPDGTPDASFIDPAITGGGVEAIAVQSDGKVVIGGYFTAIAGRFRSAYFGRLNPDGSIDGDFQANATSGSSTLKDWIAAPVFALALAADGKILVAGSFYHRLVRVKLSGFFDRNYPVFTSGSSVESLALTTDGKLVISGLFSVTGGSGAARLKPDGTLDSFAPNVRGKIALSADGNMYLGGNRVNANGTIDPTIATLPGNVLFQPDGSLLVAGAFTSIAGANQKYLARVFNTPAGSVLSALPNDIRIQWLRGASAPEIQPPRVELSIDAGNTWSALGTATPMKGGWEVGGITLPSSGMIRARAKALGAIGTGYIEEICEIAPDAETLAPLLIQPQSGTRTNVLRIASFMPELPLNGSARLTLQNATRTYELTLSSAGASPGSNAFTIMPGNPLSSAAVASISGGASIDDGIYQVHLSYRDWLGHPVANSSSVEVTIDATSASAPLVQPISGQIYGRTVPVAFTLPEAAQPSSVVVSFQGPSAKSITLQAGYESAGSHEYSFDASTLSSGKYSVTLRYNDLVGNAAPLSTVLDVLIDVFTEAPYLASPATGGKVRNPIPVAFTLPEGALTGTLQLKFSSGSDTYPFTLATSEETKGDHSFLLNPTNPTASPEIAAGSPLPDGTYTASLVYQDLLGNPARSVENSAVLVDTVIEAPLLGNPSDDTAYDVVVPVSFYLPEAAQPGGVRLRFEDGVNVYEAVLTATQETAGTHTFGFNPTNPRASSAVESSPFIPNGSYQVSLTYLDVSGNVAASRVVSNVTIGITTPTLNLPGEVIAEATGPAGAAVTFQVSASDAGSGLVDVQATPPAGSVFPIGTTTVQVAATDGNGNVARGSFAVTVHDTTAPVLAPGDIYVEATSPSGAPMNIGAPPFQDAVGLSSVVYQPPAGTLLSLGRHRVTGVARDAAGNAVSGEFDVVVRDTTAPRIQGQRDVSVDTLSLASVPVYYSFQLEVTDAVGAVGVAYTKGSGSLFSAGTHTVTITARDAAGNTGTATFKVKVNVLPSAERRSQVAMSKNQSISRGMIPGGYSYILPSDFSAPTLDRDGNFAFLATWRTGGQHGANLRGVGVFLDNEAVAVTGVKFSSDGWRYQSFGAPVLAGGRIAFLARLAGESPDSRGVVVAGSNSTDVKIIARTGSGGFAPGTELGRFKSFKSVAVNEDAVAFLAQLAIGTGTSRVTLENDTGVWIYPHAGGGSPRCVLREGDPLGARVIKKLVAFGTGSGSPGQGRGWLTSVDGVPGALALVVDDKGDRVVVRADLQGTVTTIASSDVETGISSIGVPAMNDSGDVAFLASAPVGGAKMPLVYSGASTGLIAPLVAAGDITNPDQASSSPEFVRFKDPLLAEDGGLSFCATTGRGAQNLPLKTSVWWKPAGGTLGMVAALQDSVPSDPGIHIRRFDSMALVAGRGPLFTADITVQGSAGLRRGLIGTDELGKPKLIIRTGDDASLGHGKLTSFQALQSSVGATGSTRGFTNDEVIWVGRFATGHQAIVVTALP